MRKNSKNEKVIRAMAIGISAMLMASSPLTALAAEGEGNSSEGNEDKNITVTPEAGVCDQAEAVAKDADKAVEGAEKSAADVKAEVVDQVVAGEAKDTQGKDLSQAVLDANAKVEDKTVEGGSSLKDAESAVENADTALGVAEAKAIAYAKKLPLVGVHHIEGHVSANYIEHPDLEPPFLCLIVSGGHTHLVIVKDYGEFEILGRTRDDAAGEAFDKVARAIGLGYPGGPKVDKLSKEGNPNAIEFPRAKIGDCPYDFSFSGVKSAVLNYLNHAQMTGEEVNRADLAASFQKAVVDVLVEHTMLAAKDYGMTKVAIAGGVASNGTLRAAMEEACKKNNYSFYRPSPIFCTDNAAMIGVAAYYEYIKGTRHGWDLNAVPNLKLGER